MKQDAAIEMGLERLSVKVEMGDERSGKFWVSDVSHFSQTLIDYYSNPIILHIPATALGNTIYITQARIDRSTGHAVCLVDFSTFP